MVHNAHNSILLTELPPLLGGTTRYWVSAATFNIKTNELPAVVFWPEFVLLLIDMRPLPAPPVSCPATFHLMGRGTEEKIIVL